MQIWAPECRLKVTNVPLTAVRYFGNKIIAFCSINRTAVGYLVIVFDCTTALSTSDASVIKSTSIFSISEVILILSRHA